MPMYEKGSVRAEPRSKQQERMKKIMKKFLSSLLALTMILSLVIVPANAADTDVTAPESTSVDRGSTQTVTATAPTSTSFSDLQGKGNYTAGTPTWRWSEDSSHFDIKSGGDTATVTIEGKSKTTSAENLTCTYKVVYTKAHDNDTADAPATITVTRDASVKVTVNDKILASDVTAATYKGHDCTVRNNKVYATKYNGEADFTSDGWTVMVTGYTGATATYSSGSLTITKGGVTGTIPVEATTPTLSVAPSASLGIPTVDGHYEVVKGGSLVLNATSNVSDAHYAWYVSSTKVGEGATYSDAPTTVATDVITLTCKVYAGEADLAHDTNLVKTVQCSYKVVDEDYIVTLNGGKDVTLTEKNEKKPVQAVFTPKNSLTPVSNVTYNFEPSKDGIVDLSSDSNETGATILTLLKDGSTRLTAKVSYKGHTYSDYITITGNMLSGDLDEVTNGEKLTIDYDDLESLANKVLPKSVSVKNNSRITVTDLPSSAGEGGLVYDGSSKKTSYVFDTNDSLEFRAAEGYIGTATMNMTVTGDDNETYKIVVNIPVTSAKEINETVTGSTANSNVSFKVKDVVDYDYLYVYGTSKGSGTSATFNPGSLSNSSTTGYDAYWSGRDAKSGWVRFDDTDTITIPASEFSKSTGKVTLYVVGLESDGTAHSGTITVSQKSYDIEYNVVAGKSVNFDQKAFEDFMDDYADDNISTSKGDYFEFDYVKFSLPSSTSGTLYEGSSKIKSSDEISNLDKVSFDSTTKAKGTINIGFTLYAKHYDKNDKLYGRKDVAMSGNVAISVVNEDVTYTVGVNSSVTLKSSDFLSYLNSVTGYRTAKIDYVKFDVKNASSYLYGGLYRTANGTLVDSKDSFYYSPSRNQYDLDDVTYATTRWSEAGKTVYIPFTIYTTSSSSKGVDGTLAITIKQAMNFVDVNPGDFFYQPVQWAVNEGITKGTSSTTFSPYKNCNRAEIVTFLWRAAGTPEPTGTRNPFTDVNSVRDASYYKAILWASQKGITAGTNATTFSPYQECTRSQIVTFLYRYAGKPSGYYSNPFKDVSSVNEASYYNAILWAVGKGITQGTSTTTFSPYASCTRGEAVTFLYRYVNGVK